jgi:hypothetical protein
MRIIAMTDLNLYRAVHAYALSAFGEAAKYYHVSTDLSNIPDICTLSENI